MLLVVLCATISGMEGFVETKLWVEHRLEFLRCFLPFERSIPSHDTLNDVINALEPALFKECFTNWVEALRERDGDIIAIDGKTSRRSHDRGKGRGPLHMVSAWATRQRLVLGQQACAEKGSVANFNHVKSGLIFRRTYAASAAKTSNSERLSFANCLLRIICATSMPAIIVAAE